MSANNLHSQDEIDWLIDDLDVTDSTKEDLKRASRFDEIYKKEGIFVFKHIYPKYKAKEFVEHFWDHLLSLPYKPKFKKQIATEIKKLGLRENPWKDLSKEDMKILRKLYPMTGGFGALTLPPAFQSPEAWKARQDPVIYSVFSKLFGTKDILTTFDRLSFKFPGQGETEFTHWDSNPWEWPTEKAEQIQGILALSKTSFRAVPETHTLAFQKKFIKKYPLPTRHDQYHVTAKHDPFGLRSKVETYPLDVGDLVVWSNRLLHEARKNTTKKIRYAMFLSYYPRAVPPEGMVESYSKAKVDIMKDRKQSFCTGKNPMFHPSGTKVGLYARSHIMYHPEVLNKFCKMWLPEAKGCKDYTYKSGKKKGTTIQIPIEWNPRELGIYTPPKLTEIGVQVLGFEPDC